MQAKERVSLLLAICFLYLSQSSYVDQSKDKQEDSPEWVTHAGFVTLILTASFCPISSVCSPSAGVPATRHYLDTAFRTIRVVRERAIVKMDTEAW